MLTTEANPIAFIIENAGGTASNGKTKIAELQPENNDQATPFYAGSKALVEELEMCCD